MSVAGNGKSKDGPGASGGARQLGSTQKKDGGGHVKGTRGQPKGAPNGQS